MTRPSEQVLTHLREVIAEEGPDERVPLVHQGVVLADRFVIEALAGRGGMGSVFRATDRASHGHVAVKVLENEWDRRSAASDEARRRFEQEARVLAGLSHPGIVRYVAHGLTPEGEPFLAMEWVEGETLAARLARGPLTVADAVSLGRRTAEALGSAHRSGVVHRDVKPSNLALVEGRIDHAKLIDFGIARVVGGLHLTRTGLAVGSVAYMAPEQARGATELDGRADLYSLGVVLYRALVGEVPFSGGDLLALLAKVLLEPSPYPRGKRKDVPKAFADLIDALLAKDPADRPATADEVVRAIDAIDLRDVSPASAPAPVRLTRREKRLASLIVLRPLRRPIRPDDATRPVRTPAYPALTAVAERHGSRLEALADGSLVAIMLARGSGTDLATAAARCALALRPLAPETAVAIATGSADVSGDLGVGEVIERAAALASRFSDGVRLDSVTARLLDERFVIVGHLDDAELTAERQGAGAARLLLGRPTPYVGREREMGALLGVADDCLRDSVARVVLLVGPAGAGKSRLCHEFLQAVPHQAPGSTVWIARADPMSAGAHLDMMRQIVHSAVFRDAEGDPGASNEERLRAYVAKLLPGDRARSVSTFLAQLLGIPLTDTDDVQLRAARASPVLMGDQMRLAWEDFVRAHLSSPADGRPRLLVLVLEDIHWSDQATVQWLDTALAQLADLPLFVLASARPAINTVFPRIWEERIVLRLPMSPLGRVSCELLVRHVLGEQVAAEVVASIVEQAAGNAFFLEELIRNKHEGRERAPATVLAMVQAELEALDSFDRALLRAASVFGRTFGRDALASLLRDVSEAQLEDSLTRLVARELLRPLPGGELYFRHDLVREAAYASLTEGDRKAAHKLAGRWLDEKSCASTLVLAGNFERGGDDARAAAALVRAAEMALEAADPDQALAFARKAVGLGVPAKDVPRAYQLMAVAHRERGEFEASYGAGRAAMDVAVPHGALWYRAAAEIATACPYIARADELRALAAELMASPHGPETVVARIAALTALTNAAAILPDGELTARLVASVESEVAPFDTVPPEVVGSVEFARVMAAMMRGDFDACIVHARRRIDAEARVANLPSLAAAWKILGFMCATIGDYEGVERALREGVDVARRMGLVREAATTRMNLALALARMGRHDEALELAARASEGLREEPSSFKAFAMLHFLLGDLESAERRARAAIALDTGVACACYGRALLARVLVRRGANTEALELATEARRRHEAIIIREPADAIVELAYAEALEATGDHSQARAVVANARDALREQAARLTDEASRRTFLERVPENRATMALADRLLAQVSRPGP